MARNRARGRSLNLVASVLGLLLLAGVAFLLGALAGLVWKEPDLLVAYLSGETTEVAWGDAAPDALPPVGEAGPAAGASPAAAGAAPAAARAAVAAAAPRPAPQAPAAKPRSVSPVPAPPAARPPPSPRPPAVAAAPPSAAPPARIAVQVGAFGERTAAERLRADLQSDGFPAYVMTAAGSGTPRWRVRVGPYPSRDQAEGVAARLKRGHRLPTWVLDEDAE